MSAPPPLMKSQKKKNILPRSSRRIKRASDNRVIRLPVRRSARLAALQAKSEKLHTANPLQSRSHATKIQDFSRSPSSQPSPPVPELKLAAAQCEISRKSPLDETSPDSNHSRCFLAKQSFKHQPRVLNSHSPITATPKDQLKLPKASDSTAWSEINIGLKKIT